MKCKTMLAIIACLSVSLSAGCSKEESSSPSEVVKKPQKSEKAATPKDVLKNMADAVREGDKDAFVACFDATEDQKKGVGASWEMIAVTMKFEDAMKKEYGEDAVKEVGSKGNLDDLKDDKWLEEVDIKIDGDRATATKDNEPLNLVKKDGDWKISADDMWPAEQMKDLDKTLKMFEAMIKVTKDATAKIGKEGYTAEKINQEMGMDMMKAMREAAGNKPLPGG